MYLYIYTISASHYASEEGEVSAKKLCIKRTITGNLENFMLDAVNTTDK